jgi:ribosome-binding factor A
VTGRRPERLASEIRDEIARMVVSDLKDPRLGFVTVTRVELTSDLRYARVFVGVLGSEEEQGRSLGVLRRAAGFVRGAIGRRMRLRFAPEIDFRYDRGLEAADRVARLLADEARRAPEAEETPPPPDADTDGSGEPE